MNISRKHLSRRGLVVAALVALIGLIAGPAQATSAFSAEGDYSRTNGNVDFSAANHGAFNWGGFVCDKTQDGQSGLLFFRITFMDGSKTDTQNWYDSLGAFTCENYSATPVVKNKNIKQIVAWTCRQDLGGGGSRNGCNDGSVLDNPYTG